MNDDYFNPLKMKHGYGFDQEEDNMSFYENTDSAMDVVAARILAEEKW